MDEGRKPKNCISYSSFGRRVAGLVLAMTYDYLRVAIIDINTMNDRFTAMTYNTYL